MEIKKLIKKEKKNAVLMKTAPEFREWLVRRQSNLQKVIPYPNVRLTMMDTQRIIARTDGVELNSGTIKKLKEKKK